MLPLCGCLIVGIALLGLNAMYGETDLGKLLKIPLYPLQLLLYFKKYIKIALIILFIAYVLYVVYSFYATGSFSVVGAQSSAFLEENSFFNSINSRILYNTANPNSKNQNIDWE